MKIKKYARYIRPFVGCHARGSARDYVWMTPQLIPERYLVRSSHHRDVGLGTRAEFYLREDKVFYEQNQYT